jgi:hypothetical protein
MHEVTDLTPPPQIQQGLQKEPDLRRATASMGVVFACMCIVAPAYGVQELTLREAPPLQPLHWCKHSNGNVVEQIDPCGPDSMEVSSVMERKSDGKMVYRPLEKDEATSSDGKSAASDSASKDDPNTEIRKSPLGDFWKRIASWFAFALIVGLVAQFLNRSFVLWLILGFVLRAILVALNVIAF